MHRISQCVFLTPNVGIHVAEWAPSDGRAGEPLPGAEERASGGGAAQPGPSAAAVGGGGREARGEVSSWHY